MHIIYIHHKHHTDHTYSIKQTHTHIYIYIHYINYIYIGADYCTIFCRSRQGYIMCQRVTTSSNTLLNCTSTEFLRGYANYPARLLHRAKFKAPLYLIGSQTPTLPGNPGLHKYTAVSRWKGREAGAEMLQHLPCTRL